jgi:hypothetical protein
MKNKKNAEVTKDPTRGRSRRVKNAVLAMKMSLSFSSLFTPFQQ